MGATMISLNAQLREARALGRHLLDGMAAIAGLVGVKSEWKVPQVVGAVAAVVAELDRVKGERDKLLAGRRECYREIMGGAEDAIAAAHTECDALRKAAEVAELALRNGVLPDGDTDVRSWARRKLAEALIAGGDTRADLAGPIAPAPAGDVERQKNLTVEMKMRAFWAEEANRLRAAVERAKLMAFAAGADHLTDFLTTTLAEQTPGTCGACGGVADRIPHEDCPGTGAVCVEEGCDQAATHYGRCEGHAKEAEERAANHALQMETCSCERIEDSPHWKEECASLPPAPGLLPGMDEILRAARGAGSAPALTPKEVQLLVAVGGEASDEINRNLSAPPEVPRIFPEDPFHPVGRCECSGEGECDWCVRTAEKEEA